MVCLARFVMALFFGGGAALRQRKSRSTANSTQACTGACYELYQYQTGQGYTHLGGTDMEMGTSSGWAYRYTYGFWDQPTLLWSAAKMVTGYTILKLIDSGLLSLDTKAADVLSFWNTNDKRKDVTVKHLLSMTAGMKAYPDGLAQCSESTTRECARQAFNECFQSSFTPGEQFLYANSNFYVVSAMALEVTGLATWDEVFQRYVAQPLGINGNQCAFDYPNRAKAMAGGGLTCSTADYGKFLQGIIGKTLFNNDYLYNEAERPQTLNAFNVQSSSPENPACNKEQIQSEACDEQMMSQWSVGALNANVYTHYGLGQWVECRNSRCDGGVLRTSSLGLAGTYPWLDRGTGSGNAPHYGIVVRWYGGYGTGAGYIRDNVLPLVAEWVA